jgi:hypothetical protein
VTFDAFSFNVWQVLSLDAAALSEADGVASEIASSEWLITAARQVQTAPFRAKSGPTHAFS